MQFIECIITLLKKIWLCLNHKRQIIGGLL
jgi:hypothetical protein